MPHFKKEDFPYFIRTIINSAARKAGGIDNLLRILDVDNSSLNRYWNGRVFPNTLVFIKMLNYVGICNIEINRYEDIVLEFIKKSFNNHENKVTETCANIGVNETNFRRWLNGESVPSALHLSNILYDVMKLNDDNINNLNFFEIEMFQNEYNIPFWQNKNTKNKLFYVKSFSNNYCSASN